MPRLNPDQEKTLIRFARALIDQEAARTIIPANQPRSGFWFGGGNLLSDQDSNIYVVGRFRNAGDSRTGIAAGERGLELAIFRSNDRGVTFEKIVSWSKSSLDMPDQAVLSIEGSALRWSNKGVELFVSCERSGIAYPPGLENFLKPGTGVWTVEKLVAPDIQGLSQQNPERSMECRDAQFLHVKDPFIHETADSCTVLFCTHPFCWTSSNTGYVRVQETADECRQSKPVYDFFPRGYTWDVAMTRGTCILDIPRAGLFEHQDVSLFFYDGGECVRNHDEHQTAVNRPRGYSCEELGGLAYIQSKDLTHPNRLSVEQPLFVSPHATGCSRYVDVHRTKEGYFATWQQAQPDGSQPLVMNFVSNSDAVRLLT